MKFLMLVLAGSDFEPPDTIGEDTAEWVRRARSVADRRDGGRLRPPGEAAVLGPEGGAVSVRPGPRVDDDEQIVGFDVLECDDRDSAVALVRTHPMAQMGRIELRAVWGDVE